VSGFTSPRPHFVIVGARTTQNGEFMVIASDTLTQFSLTLEDLEFDAATFDRVGQSFVRATSYTLNGVLHNFRLAYGATYADAFAKLFEDWNPDIDQAEIEAPRRALPHG